MGGGGRKALRRPRQFPKDIRTKTPTKKEKETDSVGRSPSQGLGSILGALPAPIGAVLILIIGCITAKVVPMVVASTMSFSLLHFFVFGKAKS